MNSDAKKLKEVVNLFATSESARKKKLKEKVFLKGELAEIRNHFSKDWYIADLIDVTHLITCGVAKRPEYIESGTPFLSAQNTRPFKTNLNKIKFISREAFERLTVGGKPEKGDVLYTRVGNCGEAAKIQFDFDFAIYVSLTLIKPYRNLLNTDYFVAFLNSQFGLLQAAQGAIGIGLKNLNVDNVRRYIIPLPPLAEQKVIADKLDTLLAQVETTKARLDRIPQILKIFRQSVLSAAVSGKLTEEWREENSLLEPISLDDINSYWTAKYLESGKKRQSLKLIESVSLTEVPTSWINTNIGYVFDVYVGATPSRKNEDYWNGDVSWVSSSEVAFCRINSTKETVTKLGLAKTSTNIHPPGTVMLAMIGQGKTRGQVALLDIEACHNQNTAALRVPTNFVVSEYLYFYLTKQYEETRRVGGGNNQQALNKSFVQSLEFPLPPFNEQTEIVRRVEQLFAHADKIEQQVQAAQQRVDKLTQSILAKAFRGELTTQWRKDNPDLITGDNSAEALLTKIKAEREAKLPKKKAKTKKAKA
jgi:type I restriction enzyme S subunit